jgi:hypothetical protein
LAGGIRILTSGVLNRIPDSLISGKWGIGVMVAGVVVDSGAAFFFGLDFPDRALPGRLPEGRGAAKKIVAFQPGGC